MDSFTPTVVGREISAVGFSFYAPDEIRAMSVTAVYNPEGFDSLGHPNRGGLFDPLMGPIDRMAMFVDIPFSSRKN